MNKYKGNTNRELLIMNGWRDFQDSQLEEEICSRAGLLKEWVEVDCKGLESVVNRAIKILLKMEGITCPTEELLDYLLNPDKYAKAPKKLLQHALICKYCRRILYNPKIQKAFIYAMTRQTAFEFLNYCKKD